MGSTGRLPSLELLEAEDTEGARDGEDAIVATMMATGTCPGWDEEHRYWTMYCLEMTVAGRCRIDLD